MRSHAFTLVELIVVVAIIALLISILLPSLGRARSVARAAVCGSNIRQLAQTNQFYAHDNRQYFVLAARDIWSDNFERWHGKRAGYGEAFDPARSDLARYFGPDGRLKQCPGFIAGDDYDDTPGISAAFEAGCGGYGYNQSYIGGRCDLFGSSDQAARNSAAAHEFAHPAATIVFTDAAFVATTGSFEFIAYSFAEPPYWQLNPGEPSTMRPNPSVHFRHIGQTSVAWADGHVDRQSFDFTSEYITHSHITSDTATAIRIGWFGPDDNSLFDIK